MFFEPASLENICFARSGKRMRCSSYDRTGGNEDRLQIVPGETVEFANIPGAGLITHIWVTMGNDYPHGSEHYNTRKVYLNIYWDGEENPSVSAPIGDFFGVGHGVTRNFVSEPLQMSPQNGRSMNCWFPMPFAKGARFTVTNECFSKLFFYFYVDYEHHDSIPNDTLRFHAEWRREALTDGVDAETCPSFYHWLGGGGENTTGEGNYVILEAEGKGHYVGCNMNIHNQEKAEFLDWPGEGDDMIFIDDEPWPPRLHGTGTEDYVNTAWSPQQLHSAPQHGITMPGDDNWKGKISYYRYHMTDPINFEKSIRVTIEHGHNNHRSDDWSTTAYWYQTEPHKPLPERVPVKQRLPLDGIGFNVQVMPD